MTAEPWPAEREPYVVGVLVHGPAVVARSPGIGVAVRCIFAHPGGLEMDLVLRATGVQAEGATRQTFGEHVERYRPAGHAGDGGWLGSELTLSADLDGERRTVYPHEQSHGGGEESFEGTMRVSIDALPGDRVITLTASWPQAGLAEGSVTLTLDRLDNLESRVIRLP